MIRIVALSNMTWALLLPSLLLFSCVSQKGTVKTYINPSIDASKIRTVAIFPLRNAFVQTNIGLGTGEMIDINRMFQTAFVGQNPNTKLVNAVESREMLNTHLLVNSYDTLLTVFHNTGIPNTQILNKIGRSLQIDAIIQGFVREVSQRDGIYGGNRGETKIVIRYVMLSTITGDVIWEATCEGYKGTSTTLEKAPPVDDVIEIIKEKIVSAMPALSSR